MRIAFVAFVLSMLMWPTAVGAQAQAQAQAQARPRPRPRAQAPVKAPAPAAAPDPAPAAVAGKWEGDIGEKEKAQHIVLTMTVSGSTVEGSILTPTAELGIEQGTIKGKTLEFTTGRRVGGEPLYFYWTGIVTGDTIAFSYIDQYRQGPFTKFTVTRQK